MEGVDDIVQDQIEHIVGQLQQATQAEVAIVITTKGPATQCAVKMTGDSEAQAKTDSLCAMICVAAGCMRDQTGGKYKLMIQGPDGQLTDALPKGADVRTGNKFP